MKNRLVKAVVFSLFFLGLSMQNIAQTVLPGSVAGSPDVSTAGSFTYTIPLTLPSGIKDLMPQIALVYNSQSGNGPLGMGWSLTGLSCVSRIPTDIYHDLGISPVNLNGNDHFALNGGKLISTGPGTYRSTVEEFSEIHSSGSAGSGPASFEVQTQDGLIYTYGGTPDSRMIASSGTEVLMWSLSRVSDRNGNYIDYHYQSTPSLGIHELDKITYAGNFVYGPAANCEIDFGYQSRTDNQIKYVHGSMTQQTERLNSIIIKYGTTTIHKYDLLYGMDFYSHLIKITETGEGGNVLPSTDFTYVGSASAVTEGVTPLGSDPALPAASKHAIITGDYNGDGFTDVCGVNPGSWPTIPRDYGMYMNLGGDNFNTVPPPGGSGPIPMEIMQQYGAVKATLDFNGDGKTDIVTVTYQGSPTSGSYVAYLHISNGVGFNAPSPIYSNGGGTDKFENVLITAGNFLGNGKQQLLLAFPDNPPVPSSTGPCLYHVVLRGDGFDGFIPYTTITQHCAEFQAMDFDGDGKDELFTTIYTVMPPFITTRIYSFTTLFNPSTKLPISGSTVMTNYVNMSYPTWHHSVFYGDFNGDGMSDVLTWEPSASHPWEIGYSVGNNITKINVSDPADPDRNLGLSNADPGLTVPLTGTPMPTPTLTDDHNIRVADFNGDGKDDILEIYSAAGSGAPPYRFKVYYSKGDQTFAEVYDHPFTPTLLSNIEDGSISVGDFNGDGQADVLLHPDGDDIRLLYFHKEEWRHLIKQIDKNNNELGSNGEQITVTYEPLTYNNLYQPCSVAPLYPFIETVSGSMKLVKTLQSNRTPLSNSYYYKGSLVHATGLGFRGFERFQVVNSATSRSTVQTFKQQLFERVMPLEFSLYSTASPVGSSPVVSVTMPYPLLSRKLFAFAEDILPNDARLIYPVTETTEDLVNNLHTQTTYTYSASSGSLHNYGKPDKITTDAGYGTEVTEQEFLYSTGSAQFYNRDDPATITVKRTRTGSPTYTRTTSYTYDANGQVSAVKADPGTPHENSVSYGYDFWGNVLSETSTVGASSVTTNFTYSPDRRFLAQKVNAAGHSESFVGDEWGNIKTYTNINGVVTTNAYDDFGRKISSTNSSTPGITNSITYHWANSPSLTSCPPGIFYQAIEQKTTGILGSSIEYYDYNGNVVRSVHPDFSGSLIYNDVTYQPDGSINKESLPYHPGSPVLTTNYIFDFTGRKYSITTPTSGTTTFSYVPNSFSPSNPFGGMSVTASNATSLKSTETITDASGKTTEILDCGISTLKNTYNSNGKLSSTNANGLNTFFNYDSYGNLLSEDAPNKNTTTYTYDNRNRVKTVMDGASVTFTYMYDNLNRIISKTASGVAFTYTYDGAGVSSYGNLTNVVGPVPTTSANYAYDPFSRLISRTEIISGTTPLTTLYSYDAYGRPATTKYPDLNTIRNEYNNYGYLYGIWGVGLGTGPTVPDMPIWRKNAENVFGQTTNTSMGLDPSAVIWAPGGPTLAVMPMVYEQAHNYNTHGFLTNARLSTASSTLNNNNYTFNEPTGNLLTINDILNARAENFTYDILDRLTSAAQSFAGITSATQTFSYAANGNIVKKSDISSSDWRYNKYAVAEIPSPTIAIPTFTQTATYTPFDKVETIVEDNKTIKFFYGPNEQRGKAEYYTGTTHDRTRFYARNYEKTVDALSGFTQQISYIMAEGRPVAMLEKNGGAPTVIKYIGTDHLGSIMHVLNGTGTPDEDRSYDAWGRERNPINWTYNFTGIISYPYQYDRGYTAQEYLRDFNVMNLNGRLYDPLIGRMLSVDPYITNPANAQTYNGYSYAYNNPLKYNDKNGEWGGWDDVAAMAIGGTVNVAMHWSKIKATEGGVGDKIWAGVCAFGVGAIAGEAALLTGGLVLGATGLTAASVVGGGVSAAAGTAVASPLLGLGNKIQFDEEYTSNQWLRDVSFSFVGGAVVGGSVAYFKGNNVWLGKPVAEGRTRFSLRNKPVPSKPEATPVATPSAAEEAADAAADAAPRESDFSKARKGYDREYLRKQLTKNDYHWNSDGRFDYTDLGNDEMVDHTLDLVERKLGSLSEGTNQFQGTINGKPVELRITVKGSKIMSANIFPIEDFTKFRIMGSGPIGNFGNLWWW